MHHDHRLILAKNCAPINIQKNLEPIMTATRLIKGGAQEAKKVKVKRKT
jgi:hypothetical protein